MPRRAAAASVAAAVLVLCAALAWPAPAAADTVVALVDLRPVGGGRDRGTDLTQLADAVRITMELRRILETRGRERGVTLVPPARLPQLLGRYYRVELFECREEASCVVDRLAAVAGRGVDRVIVGMVRVEEDRTTVTLHALVLGTTTFARTEELSFATGSLPREEAAAKALFALAGVKEQVPEPAPAVEPSSEPPPEPAEEPEDTPQDDAFEFGGEVDAEADALATDSAEPSALSLGGTVRSSWAAWTERLDDNPFAKGRQSLDLWGRYTTRRLRVRASIHGEYDLAYLHERDSYDEPTLDAYEWRVDTRELYVSATSGRLDVTVGRQIVPWGVGLVLSPVDVVNPRDEREPGQTDLEDQRLPVLATRLGWFPGRHRLEAMVVHETSFGYRPPPFGPYSPVAELLAPLAGKEVDYHDLQDRFDIDQQQLFARWAYAGDLDVALYAASLLDRLGTFALPPAEELAQPSVTIELDHDRYLMLGTSGALPGRKWVLRWEASAEVDRPAPIATADGFGAGEGTLVVGMLGGTYEGFRSTLLSVEVQRGFWDEEPAGLLFPFEAFAVALRAERRLRRDEITLVAVVTASGLELEYGWLARLEVDLLLRESLHLTLGYVTYHPGDELGPIAGFDTHDRAFAQLRWDFVGR